MSKLLKAEDFTHIFFDADDTLWCNEEFFRSAERDFAEILADCNNVEATIAVVTQKQEENIRLFGYGSKTFLISMLDAGAEICGDKFNAGMYLRAKEIIRNLSYHDFDLIDGARETLALLSRRFTLVLATKGDLVEQLYKFRNSGLAEYFAHTEVMPTKSKEDYLAMAAKFGLAPEKILMVGNAVRSDIAPVIEIGGVAVHIPYKVSWAHEVVPMPDSPRLYELKSIKDLPKLLL